MPDTRAWTLDELNRLDAEDEIDISSYRADGTLRACRKALWRALRPDDASTVRRRGDPSPST